MNDLAEAPARRPWLTTRTGYFTFTVVAALFLVVTAFAARTLPKGSPGRIGIALVQGAVSAAVIVTMMRKVRRLDELQLKLHLDGFAFSFAATGILGTAYGFLVNAGLPDVDWGAFVWPVMVSFWVVGLAIARRRYQ